jgi:hypothetical protein
MGRERGVRGVGGGARSGEFNTEPPRHGGIAARCVIAARRAFMLPLSMMRSASGSPERELGRVPRARESKRTRSARSRRRCAEWRVQHGATETRRPRPVMCDRCAPRVHNVECLREPRARARVGAAGAKRTLSARSWWRGAGVCDETSAAAPPSSTGKSMPRRRGPAAERRATQDLHLPDEFRRPCRAALRAHHDSVIVRTGAN